MTDTKYFTELYLIKKYIGFFGVNSLAAILFAVLFCSRVIAGSITPDSTFGTNGRTSVLIGGVESSGGVMSIQEDNKVVVLGTAWDGSNRNVALSRFNTDGTLDSSFGSGGSTVVSFGNFTVRAENLAIQPDGKIVIVGGTIQAGLRNCVLARFNNDGSLDSPFGNNGKIVIDLTEGFEVLQDIVLRPDGKILTMGTLETNRDFFLLAQFNNNGSLDQTFGSNGISVTAIGSDSAPSAIILQPDGSIFVTGKCRTNSSDLVLSKFNSGGNLDTSFGSNGYVITDIQTGSVDFSSEMALQSDGRIIVSGFFYNDEDSDFILLRYNPNGTLDTTFGTNGKVITDVEDDNYPRIVVQNDNKILLAGRLQFGGENRFVLLRYLSGGSRDLSFGIQGQVLNETAEVYDLKIQKDGKILISGDFYTGNVFYNVVIRYKNSLNSKMDFDGDGKSDISVFRPSNGVWYLQQSTSGFAGVAFGANDDVITPADFDGDGKTDIAVFRPSNGTWYLQQSTAGFTGIGFGASGDIPMPADYDGDGKADLAVFRPSNGVWYIQGSQAGFYGTAFGANGDKPVAADYDGDGKVDLAVFRPSNGVWYLNRSQLGFTGVSFGDSADKPVLADYDGDGKTDIAVFRPSNGVWYLQQSTNGFVGIGFGAGDDLPVPADYDGDGKTDVSVFRPSNGVWYLQRSTQGFTGISFGASGDKPTPNAFIH